MDIHQKLKLLNELLNPLWKPLFWKPYWEYMAFEDFLREYYYLCDKWISSEKPVKQHLKCEVGGFYYDQEDEFFYYKFAGKTRKMVHRILKQKAHMANRKLYEKTPSEKGVRSPFQTVLTQVNGEKHE